MKNYEFLYEGRTISLNREQMAAISNYYEVQGHADTIRDRHPWISKEDSVAMGEEMYEACTDYLCDFDYEEETEYLMKKAGYDIELNLDELTDYVGELVNLLEETDIPNVLLEKHTAFFDTLDSKYGKTTYGLSMDSCLLKRDEVEEILEGARSLVNDAYKFAELRAYEETRNDILNNLKIFNERIKAIEKKIEPEEEREI